VDIRSERTLERGSPAGEPLGVSSPAVTGYSSELWESFFVANAGAAAALAGLVFVGTSINIARIAPSPRLSGRALEAFVLLAEVLVVAVLGLVPEIGRTGLGIALGLVGAAVWLVVTRAAVASLPSRSGEAVQGPRGSNVTRVVLGQLATVPLIVAAVTLLVGSGGGLFWLVPAIVFAYVTALGDAWVLLVEIVR